MTLVPVLDFNGQITNKKIGIFSYYKKSIDIILDEIEFIENDLKIKYTLDFHSSVWIGNPNIYDQFSQKYVVVAGGWYGTDGRWNTIKRTFGTVIFSSIENYNQKITSDDVKNRLAISKTRLSRRVYVEISTNNKQLLFFDCNEIIVNPSNRILLLNRESNQFVDRTDILTSNGLGLIEEKFY